MKYVYIFSALIFFKKSSSYLLAVGNVKNSYISVYIFMSPVYRGGDTLLYFSPLICLSDQFCVCQFCVCVLSVYHAVGQTWNVDPMPRWLLAHRLLHWANISPVLGYHVVFDARLNVGQRHRRRANINPAFVQRVVPILQPAWSRPTDYSWMDTSQHRRCWPNLKQTLCRVGLHFQTRSLANTKR